MKWCLLLLLPTLVFAKVKTEKVIYEKDGVKMEGLLAYKEGKKKSRPGILVFHDWMGNGAYTEMRARQLAEEGYVVLAADIYGQGVRPKDAKEASGLASKYRDGDRKVMRERAQAALDTLVSNKRVDKNKVAAIGYCFGGTVALELARSGAAVAGVVSFHGGLNTPNKAQNPKAKILALHGADDPFVPAQEVADFEKEMREGKADWQLISYGGAVHGFSQKDAGNDHASGFAYNQTADRRSWEHMEVFLDELFD